MAHMGNRANTAVDAFFQAGGAGGSSPPASPGSMPSTNSLDPNHFSRMMALQSRLTGLIAEAQSIVQELQHNGFFPRGAGNTPEEDANMTVMTMLGAAAPHTQQPRPLAGPRGNKASPNRTANASSNDSADTRAQRVPSPNMTNMPPTAVEANVPSWGGVGKPMTDTYAAPIHNAVSHNAVEEFLLSGQGNSGAQNNVYGNRAGDEDLADGTEMLAFVEFKRGRVRKYRCDHRIEPGSYVLVDGDRGTDCGLLVQTIERKPNNETAVVSMEGCDIRDDKIKLENGHVLRQASEEDIDRLHNIIANAESVALKTCRQRCMDLGIDIDLQDVEYQFDMKKISFFFDCDHSVDFRSLVRELYRTFGARIWMENINPKVKNSMPDVFSDRGERERSERLQNPAGGGGGGDRHNGNNNGSSGGGGGGWRNGRGGRSRNY